MAQEKLFVLYDHDNDTVLEVAQSEIEALQLSQVYFEATGLKWTEYEVSFDGALLNETLRNDLAQEVLQ